MKRMGRPPLPPQERKSRIIMVRLTRDEQSRLEHAAKRSGLTVSEFIRHAALKGARQ